MIFISSKLEVMCTAMRFTVFFCFKFVSKEMDDINLSNILHDKITCEKMLLQLQYFQNRPPPVISYKYFTVAARILNFLIQL